MKEKRAHGKENEKIEDFFLFLLVKCMCFKCVYCINK